LQTACASVAWYRTNFVLGISSISPFCTAALLTLLCSSFHTWSERMKKQEFEWLEVLGRGMSGVCRKVRGKDGNIMVVKQIDISFVAPEEYESATR
jgi:hypothetical protein